MAKRTTNASIETIFEKQGFIGPQGEEIVEATSLAARFGSAIVDIEVCEKETQVTSPHCSSALTARDLGSSLAVC